MMKVSKIQEASQYSSLWILSVLRVIAGSLFIALLSQLSLPIPFTPVLLTFQTLAIFLVGGVLGAKEGLFATALYLAEGALGLPFFAGGASGLAILFGMKAGYYFSFPLAAYISGVFARKGPKTLGFGLIVSNLLIYIAGATVLSFYLGVHKAIALGVIPFLATDALKLLIAFGSLSLMQKIRSFQK